MDESRFPAGAEPLPLHELAALLAASLPIADRAKGERLLTQEILPLDLAGLASHPRPRRLQEVVFDRLTATLAGQAPERRLNALRTALLSARLGDLGRQALTLAVARYLRDHPEAHGGGRTDAAVTRWLAAPPTALETEASRLIDDLKQLGEELQKEHPDLWEDHRLGVVQAELELSSARTGSFEAATGSLADFLTAAGARFRKLEIR
jgi:hypothetical protein